MRFNCIIHKGKTKNVQFYLLNQIEGIFLIILMNEVLKKENKFSIISSSLFEGSRFIKYISQTYEKHLNNTFISYINIMQLLSSQLYHSNT